jgi:hypothetical protein
VIDGIVDKVQYEMHQFLTKEVGVSEEKASDAIYNQN